MRKDFIISEKQVYESFSMGADIILLIVGILDDLTLSSLNKLALKMGLEVIIETHSEEEIERALRIDPQIIGVNNRDLNTFKVDINNALHLVSKIPDHILKVAESGMHSSVDIKKVENAGFNAVLIGEAFMKNGDIESEYRKLFA